MTELFDKKYVYFEWEDELEGKEGFAHENIKGLKMVVNGSQAGIKTTVRKADDDMFVSNTTNRKYFFFYYDPNYTCKRAYAEGKQIQFKSTIGNWENIDCPKWNKGMEYRIKPEEPKLRRMTYRQISEWAGKQNGEIKTINDVVRCVFTYSAGTENEELPEGYKIRRWGSDEWIEPTANVYEADCKK